MQTLPGMQRQESDSSDMHVPAAEVCVEEWMHPKSFLETLEFS